jgi:hypothetical protein
LPHYVHREDVKLGGLCISTVLEYTLWIKQ